MKLKRHDKKAFKAMFLLIVLLWLLATFATCTAPTIGG